MNPQHRLVAAAVLFSTGGTAIKWCGFGAWQVAAGRALIATWVVALIIPQARRGWSWRSAVVGVAYAGAALLYIFSNKMTTAASAIFILAGNPFFIFILGPLLLREHVTRRDIEYMAVLALGMALLLSAPGRRYDTAPNPLLGNVLATACALSWACTVVGYRWVAKRARDGRGAVAAAALSGNALVFLIALPLALPLDSGTPRDWLVLAFLGVFQLGLAYVFLSRAIPEVRALEASLVMLVEPVLSALWAWLVHGETPSARVVLGGAVILTATAWHAWREPMAAALPRATLEG